MYFFSFIVSARNICQNIKMGKSSFLEAQVGGMGHLDLSKKRFTTKFMLFLKKKMSVKILRNVILIVNLFKVSFLSHKLISQTKKFKKDKVMLKQQHKNTLFSLSLYTTMREGTGQAS